MNVLYTVLFNSFSIDFYPNPGASKRRYAVQTSCFCCATFKPFSILAPGAKLKKFVGGVHNFNSPTNSSPNVQQMSRQAKYWWCTSATFVATPLLGKVLLNFQFETNSEGKALVLQFLDSPPY